MFFNILFDLVILSFIVLGGIYGVKKGFISAIARPVKKISSVVLAMLLANPIGNALISPIIGPAISHKVSDILIEKYSNVLASSANESLPTVIRFAASMSGINLSESATTADGKILMEHIADSVTSPIVSILAVAAGFVVSFFIVKTLLNILFAFLDKKAKNSKGAINKLNKILGCVFAVLLSLAIAWCFTVSIEFFFNIPILARANAIDNFTGGPVYKLFKSISPLELLLSF